MSFVWETPEEINLALAKRLSRIRKRRNLSQVQLSEKSNVSYGSIKRRCQGMTGRIIHTLRGCPCPPNRGILNTDRILSILCLFSVYCAYIIRRRSLRMSFVWETPEEINLALAKRLSCIRKRRNLSQVQLSEKSNVSYGSIKRFETSGQISLLSLTKLCVALGCVDEIKNLFTQVEYGSIEEVLRERTQG